MFTLKTKNLFQHFCRINVPYRSFQKGQLKIVSNYFENHPINQQIIDNFEKLSDERKSHGDIDFVKKLYNDIQNEKNIEHKSKLEIAIRNEFKKFPNETHPKVLGYGLDAGNVEVDSYGEECNKDGKDYIELGNLLNMIRLEQLGNFTGSRSYYLAHHLADLESALIQYATDFLKKESFELISVPDILPAVVIEGCGMQTTAETTQVYRLQSHTDPNESEENDLCLSGTSEMALGGFFSGKTLKLEDLPRKTMAVSRCFRAEAGDGTKDKNLYRVHQFTKVEMFSVCHPDKSEEMLEYFRNIEIQLFKNLGLCFKVYDMPIHELGAPAYRKYDIEAWMPSRKSYGEISSTSNCTDYQSKRLNIYINDGEKKIHAHTVNGTACAIPRMIIAILEQFQTKKSILIPEALQPYIEIKELTRSKAVPALRIIKRLK